MFACPRRDWLLHGIKAMHKDTIRVLINGVYRTLHRASFTADEWIDILMATAPARIARRQVRLSPMPLQPVTVTMEAR